MPLSSTERPSQVDLAVHDLLDGKNVVVTDRYSGNPTTSWLVSAAQHVTVSTLDFMIRHTSGYVVAAMPGRRMQDLEIPELGRDRDAQAPRFGVSVDSAARIGTGISAADRAVTAHVLAGDSTTAEDLTRPGHVPTAATVEGGVLESYSVWEAACDLSTVALSNPVALVSALVDPDSVDDPGEGYANTFARRHGLVRIDIRDVALFRHLEERYVTVSSEVALTTADDSPHTRLSLYQDVIRRETYTVIAPVDPATVHSLSVIEGTHPGHAFGLSRSDTMVVMLPGSAHTNVSHPSWRVIAKILDEQRIEISRLKHNQPLLELITPWTRSSAACTRAAGLLN